MKQYPEVKLFLYNFEKLCGYKFSLDCVEELVKKFPDQIVGVKDSSYNLFENLKIENFSVLPGSEIKIIKRFRTWMFWHYYCNMQCNCQLSRKVYDDFIEKKEQTSNENYVNVRSVFDKYNLISGLHSFMSR